MNEHELILKHLDDEKSTAPKNKAGQPHGHWIAFHKGANCFWFECHYVNGKELGLEKWDNGVINYHAT